MQSLGWFSGLSSLLFLWLRSSTSLMDCCTCFSVTSALQLLLMVTGVLIWRDLSLFLPQTFQNSSPFKRSPCGTGITSPRLSTGHLMRWGTFNVLRNTSEYIGLIKIPLMWISSFNVFIFKRKLLKSVRRSSFLPLSFCLSVLLLLEVSDPRSLHRFLPWVPALASLELQAVNWNKPFSLWIAFGHDVLSQQ